MLLVVIKWVYRIVAKQEFVTIVMKWVIFRLIVLSRLKGFDASFVRRQVILNLNASQGHLRTENHKSL